MGIGGTLLQERRRFRMTSDVLHNHRWLLPGMGHHWPTACCPGRWRTNRHPLPPRKETFAGVASTKSIKSGLFRKTSQYLPSGPPATTGSLYDLPPLDRDPFWLWRSSTTIDTST